MAETIQTPSGPVELTTSFVEKLAASLREPTGELPPIWKRIEELGFDCSKLGPRELRAVVTAAVKPPEAPKPGGVP